MYQKACQTGYAPSAVRRRHEDSPATDPWRKSYGCPRLSTTRACCFGGLPGWRPISTHQSSCVAPYPSAPCVPACLDAPKVWSAAYALSQRSLALILPHPRIGSDSVTLSGSWLCCGKGCRSPRGMRALSRCGHPPRIARRTPEHLRLFTWLSSISVVQRFPCRALVIGSRHSSSVPVRRHLEAWDIHRHWLRQCTAVQAIILDVDFDFLCSQGMYAVWQCGDGCNHTDSLPAICNIPY